MSLEKELNAPEEVTWLDIPWKEWETVRPRLKEFTKLEMLSIRHASVDRFPASIYELSDLPHLFLDGGRIGQFPIGIAQMKGLGGLTLFKIAIPGLPPDLEKLPTIRTVDLDGIALPAFPVEKGHYPALSALKLKSCGLSALPEQLGRLPHLRILDVSGNPLTQLPSSLATAKKLEFLYAEGCRLERIPSELFSLPKLVRIDLAGNTFPKAEYDALERLAKRHPKIKVGMPRNSAKKPAPGSATPLAKSIRKDLDRLAATFDESDRPIWQVEIAEKPWPVHPALGELLGRVRKQRKIVAAVNGEGDLGPLWLTHHTSTLAEYECIHHHPYVQIADTDEYHDFVLIRLDDENPGDPMLYLLNPDDFREHEAYKLGRLSAWLKKARPAGRPAPRTGTRSGSRRVRRKAR